MSKNTSDGLEHKNSVPPKASSIAGAGAVDEDVFRQSFVPSVSVTVTSSKELSELIGRLKDTLSGNPEEWEKRVDALKTLRAMIQSDATQFDEFFPLLKTLEVPVDACLRDLRSAVVREACITVAFFSQELKNRFDRFAEAILQTLISLMSNSAKIMASSGIVAIRFILENTCSPRLLPILSTSLLSKSNVTRRCICEFMEIIFRVWPQTILERHVNVLQDLLKRGISDADQEARIFSRRAFPLFAAKFPDQANHFLQNLDAQKRKLIERDLIGAGLTGTTTLSDSNATSRSQSGSQSSLVGQNTRRPTRPILGTTAATVHASTNRNRPPLTNQNVYTAVGRYVQQVSDPRNRGRKLVSQSQPTSREVSPSRFLHGMNVAQHQHTYYPTGTYANRNGTPFDNGVGDARFRFDMNSRVPRSQGTSREVSPTRSSASGYSPSIYQHSNSVQYSGISTTGPRKQPRASLSAMSDCGDMGDGGFNRQYSGSRQPYGSDDNFSETSSQCSERSGRSLAYRNQPPTKLTSNLREIIIQLSGTQWSDRKDGLINFQNIIRSGYPLNPDDVRRLTEIFSKMFADSQSKVVSLFMDTLQLFIKEYHPLLRSWLYTLLIRLLHRQSHEALSSHQKAIQETLSVLRIHFPLALQFNTCCHFVVDTTQTPNFKVKTCLLEYMKDLILAMNSEMVPNFSGEVANAISKIISWSAEPKSADVRRMASRIVIKLYDLNSPSFLTLLQSLPRHIQDRAYELLKTYQKTASGTSGGFSDTTQILPPRRASSVDQDSHSSPTYLAQQTNRQASMSPETVNRLVRETTNGLQSLTANIPGPGRKASTGAISTIPVPLGHDVAPRTINGNSGNEANVLRTVQPNNLPNQSQISQIITPITAAHCYATPTLGSGIDPTQTGLGLRTNKIPIGGLLNYDHTDGPKLKKPVIGYQTLRKIRELPPEDIMSEILQELSNHNERHEQRKACMLKLIKLLRDGVISDSNWDEYFKPTLLILLETLGDDGSETRSLALRVLQELVRTKPELFHDFAYLFVLKILEACRDNDKAVARAAEECANTIAQYLPQELCFEVLIPLINDSKVHINLPAVKMQTQVIQNCPSELVNEFVSDIVPGLIMACNHEESSMRKASVFCLVAIALKIGDAIWDYLVELNAGKKRLLKLYIDRHLSTSTTSEDSIANRS